MVVVKLQGGLGNQMFQYAIGSILAQKNNTDVYLDLSLFNQYNKWGNYTSREFALDIFNLSYKLSSNALLESFKKESKFNFLFKSLGLPYKKSYKERSFDFDRNILQLKSPLFIEGYFQSHKYFIQNEEYIKGLFKFPEELIDFSNKACLSAIRNTESVSVHFRRGDYVTDEKTRNFHGTCTLDYFEKAFERIASRVKAPHFFIFSDDIEWVEEKIIGWAPEITFVKGNSATKCWIDMMLMANCRHHIISNSTFSWWGAWLSVYAHKNVIAPSQWFKGGPSSLIDRIPDSWQTL